MTVPYKLRAVRESDFSHITKSWVEANRETPTARALGAEYKHAHSRLVWSWLPMCHVLVAADVEDDDTILGFAVLTTTGVLHYVHVRRDFRGMGIAKALVGELAEQSVVYTHQPADATHYRRTTMQSPHPPKWRYNPYLFLTGAPT